MFYLTGDISCIDTRIREGKATDFENVDISGYNSYNEAENHQIGHGFSQGGQIFVHEAGIEMDEFLRLETLTFIAIHVLRLCHGYRCG